ncbi:phage tail tape measure protein [Winogradskyella undariae]|uniref:phage tail tape measure protein n=1 Tax=Winogradskyella undariae TaxID=1285465 RepID=UPI001C2BE289|nr:phage tail tape measure protein [Winogradskyella undariae]
MDNTLNYHIKFQTDADKVAASVERLDNGLNKVSKDVETMRTKFSSAMDKINGKLSAVRLQAFTQNVQNAAQGLDSMSAPGLKLNSSLADLSAITGVTGAGLKEIEGYARDNAKTFGGEAADGVEAYKVILSKLNPEIAKSPRALQAMGNAVSTLSKTMGGDTAGATDVLTTALNQYQVSTENPIQASKEMALMMNVMAAAAAEGSAELPEIKSALEQSGLAAKTANVSFAETNAYIQELDKAGKKGSEGGVALRNVMASLAQGRFLPKDVQKELQAAGVDVNILTDNSLTLSERLRPLQGIMNDQALITKMFGKENSNAAIAMLSAVDRAESLTTAIQGTNVAYDQAAIVMESQAEKNARIQASIDDLKISLFNVTGGALGYAKVLGDIAFDVSNLIPLFAGFAQVIQFVTSATKMQALWTGIVTTATSVWTGVQWALNVAMSPIFLIPAIVIAIGAAIAWVVSKTEGWGEAWQHTVNGGKLLFKLFGESIKLHFMTSVNAIMIGLNYIKKGWYEFKDAVGIGDSSENQRMISQITADTEARKQAIIDQANEVKKTALEAAGTFGMAAASIKWKTDVETDEAGEGISDPTIPGANLGGATAGGSGSGGSTSPKKTNKAIATGGSKHNYITINLKSLIEGLQIKGADFKDSAQQMQDQSVDALLRTLAVATTQGS